MIAVPCDSRVKTQDYWKNPLKQAQRFLGYFLSSWSFEVIAEGSAGGQAGLENDLSHLRICALEGLVRRCRESHKIERAARFEITSINA